LLELGERRTDDGGVEQPDVRCGGPVSGDLLGSCLPVTTVIAVAHHIVGQAIRLPGRGDTTADVLAFLLRRIGLDADLLDDQRPPGPDDQ
jgi:hypothetical protein